MNLNSNLIPLVGVALGIGLIVWDLWRALNTLNESPAEHEAVEDELARRGWHG